MSKKDETLRKLMDSDEKIAQWGTIAVALIVGLITLGITRLKRNSPLTAVDFVIANLILLFQLFSSLSGEEDVYRVGEFV